MDLPLHLPTALLGQIGLFAAFSLIIYLLAREAARVIIKILLIVGIVLAAALYAGWLDNSAVSRLLMQIGDWMIVGIRAVVGWIARAWEAVPSGG